MSFVKGRICKLDTDCVCHLSGVEYVSWTQIVCVLFIRGRICKLDTDCVCYLSGVGYVSLDTDCFVCASFVGSGICKLDIFYSNLYGLSGRMN